ncbi:MAG: AEC family transporter, partial [Clostridia bacterium]
MNFTLITLITVAIMLAYAIPGFLTVKTKLIKSESIPAFATILMYVCQPCLTIYSFNITDYSWGLLSQALIFLGLSFAIQCLMLGVCYLIFRKAGKENVKYRIYSVACAFGNCGFMGVPLLEALMPDHPEAVLLSTFFLLGMNLLGWTLASAIITNDKKYVSVKKAVF